MREILVIDDEKIRRKAFAEAHKLIKKLDQLESSLESFHSQDQRLFDSWYNLTFKDHRGKIDRLRGEYEHLVRFHNWVIALVKMRGISIARAARFLRKEEREYANANANRRRQIEDERQARDEFIERDFAKGFNENFFEDEDEDVFGEREESARRRDPGTDAEFGRIHEMTDEEIAEACSTRSGAEDLLSKTVYWAENFEELELFLRVWNLTDPDVQDVYARNFERKTGADFDEFLEGIREDLRDRQKIREEARAQDRARQERRKTKPDPARAEAAESSEDIKLLYRKLARRLHPDLQKSGPLPWQKKLWERVRVAYQAADRRELDRLLRLVLIRSRDLTALTFSEILAGEAALAAELRVLEDEARDLKRMPAWRFSVRKDFAPLKRRLEKALRSESDRLLEEIQNLRFEQQMLEDEF